MPLYEIQAPDGNTYRIEGPEGATKEQVAAAVLAKNPRAGIAAAKPESGFMPALRSGVESLKGEAALTLGKLGLMGLKEAEEYRAAREAEAQRIFKPTEEGWLQAPVTKTAELLGGSLPYMAAPIAAGLGAATLPVSGPTAALVGTAGAGLLSAAQFTGSNLARQMEEAEKRGEKPSLEKTELGSAAAAAVPQALLDTISLRGLPLVRNLFKSVGKELTEVEARALLDQSLKRKLADYAVTTGVVAGREGATEAGQQLFERLQAGLSITDDAARKEYVDNFIGGAVLGGVLAPGGRYFERGAERRKAERAVGKYEQEAQLKQEQEAEAAANQPDALRKLDEQYQSLLTRKNELEALVVKPAKGATPEEKQAFQEAKKAASDFDKAEFKPVRVEWEKRKDAIEALKTQQVEEENQRLQAMEQAAAPVQEAAIAPVPAAPPQLDVQRLMLEQDALGKQMQDLQTNMQAAASEGRTEDFSSLNTQRQQLQRRIDARAALIEEQGGVSVPEMQFQQQVAAKMTKLDSDIAGFQKDFAKAAAAQDFDKAAEIGLKLDAAKKERNTLAEDTAKRMQALQEKQLGMEQRGTTRELFTPQEAPVPAPEAEAVTPPTVPGVARKPAEALAVEVKPAEVTEAAAPAEPTKLEKAEEALRTAAAAKQDTATLQALNQKVQEAQAEEARGETPEKAEKAVTMLRQAMEPAVVPEGRREGERTVSPRRIEEAQQRLQDLVPTTDRTEDLFSSINVLRTGVQNNDTASVNKALNLMELRKREDAAETRAKEDASRAELIKALDERLGLGGEKVTRTASPEEVDRVLGRPADEARGIPRKVGEIEKLRNLIEQPQKNAKRSILEELQDLAAEHALITNALETGIAYKPSMKDKVTQLQASFGKGEAPAAQRQMTPQERGAATRRLQTVANRFNMLADTKVAPVRKQIEALYKSLYKREAVKAPTVVKAEKAAEASRAARGAQPMSRAAQTAERIKRGDVRKEAEASEKMLKLARELGQAEPEYQALEANISKRAQALTKRYGPGDKQTIEFNKASTKELEAKALALGRATPEYKAVLKEQTEVMRAALAETKFSKQEVPSKRTTQVTRKVAQAPRRLITESPESRVETKEEFERQQRRMQRPTERDEFDDDISTAYRKREEEGGQVDLKEAEGVVAQTKKDLPSNVKFIYAPTVRDVPVRLLNQMAREKVDPAEVQGGVFSDGTVLVIGENHANLKDLEATIAHELVGHYGVDVIIGLDRLQAYANKNDVLKLAEEVGGAKLRNEAQATMDAMRDLNQSEDIQRLQALREVIAHTEEARVTEAFRQKAGRWIKELVGMVRAGLRRMGLMEVSKLSTSDVFYMLRESRKALASKRVGVYKDSEGNIAFKQKREDTDLARSFVAEKPSLRDKFFTNVLGLAGRVQYVDKDAALSEAYKRGMSKGQITALEAQNAEFSLRFGQQVSQFAAQFLTHGKVERVANKVAGGVEYTYRSTPGANLVPVAEKLSEAGIKNDTKLEAMFTAYVAGLRAAVKGWEKLNFKDPALAQKEHADVMAFLNANPKAKKAFEEANKIYQDVNHGLIDFLVQTGEMKVEKANELKRIPFIPFYRMDGDVLNLYVEKESPIRIGNVKDQPELKQLKGGSQQIMPIFTSAVQNAYIITRIGLRNQMIKDAVFTLKKLGIVSKMGVGKGPDNASTVRYKVKGVEHFAVIDKDQFGIPAELIVKGMEGIKTATPMLVEMMGYPADVLRKFVTRAPVYALRQLIRDPLNVWLTNGTSTVPVLDAMREMGKMMAGRSEAQKNLMASGAISSNVYSGDQRDMDMFLRDISAGKSFWEKTLAKADAFALQADAATRAVVYNDSLARGMTEQQALLRTLESMNFSRRGLSPSMRWLSTMIPFFNAQIQGLDVLYRAFKGDMPYTEQLEIRKKLVSRGLLLAAGTMAYAAFMQDDEAYKRAKPEQRLANWFVYVPGVSEPVRVPIPFELGYLFKALPEAIFNKMASDDKGKDITAGMGKLLMQSNPFALPQAIKPLTEVVLGKSFFAGDIESAREERMLPTERYRATTTEVAKLLGSVTGNVGLTPIKIDYLIGGYTGGLGLALVQLANPMLSTKAADVQEPTVKPSKRAFFGGLFQPVEGRGTLDAAYERMKEIQQTKGTYDKLVEDQRTADALKFAKEHATALAFAETSAGLQRDLGELAAMRRQITEMPKMSTERKDKLLKQIDIAEQRYATPFIAMYDRYVK